MTLLQASNTAVELYRIQVLAILGSVGLLIFILWLIRNKRIKEEYSLLWLFFGGIFLFFSIWRGGLDYVSKWMGIAYPPAAIFLILLMAVFMILIQFSIIISRQAENTKKLAQDHSILKMEVQQLRKRLAKQEAQSDEDSLRA